MSPQDSTDRDTKQPDWGLGAYDTSAYLSAIGLDPEPEPPSLSYLTRLHEAHVRTFPFSNAQVLLGTHPGVAPQQVWDSLVADTRGGYCFEHAQLFAGVLDNLGFAVTRALGRVHTPDNTRSHLVVIAHIGRTDYLCDPGFGFSLRHPMEIQDGASHREGDRTFVLARHGQGAAEQWELRRDGETQHYTDLLPVMPVDVRAGHLVTSTPGFGPFTSHLMAMRHTANGHITIADTTRTTRVFGEETLREKITPEEAVESAREMGVTLDDSEAYRMVEILRGQEGR